MDWFLYDRDLSPETVNRRERLKVIKMSVCKGAKQTCLLALYIIQCILHEVFILAGNTLFKINSQVTGSNSETFQFCQTIVSLRHSMLICAGFSLQLY